MSPYHTLKCQLGEVRWAYSSVERHAHAAFSCPFYKKAHRHRRRDGRMVKRTYCPFVVDATTREQTTQQLGRKVSLYGRARRIYSNNSGGMTNLTGEAHALGLTQTRTHTHTPTAPSVAEGRLGLALGLGLISGLRLAPDHGIIFSRRSAELLAVTGAGSTDHSQHERRTRTQPGHTSSGVRTHMPHPISPAAKFHINRKGKLLVSSLAIV